MNFPLDGTVGTGGAGGSVLLRSCGSNENGFLQPSKRIAASIMALFTISF